MALKTTFAPVTAGNTFTDTELGAIYHLQNNQRLQVAAGGTVVLADDSQLIFEPLGSHHSFMNGKLKANRYLSTVKVTAGNRGDHISPDAEIEGDEMTFKTFGNGESTLHLQNKAKIKVGKINIVSGMTGGVFYVNFSDEEFPNISIGQSIGALASALRVFVSREQVHNGYTSLPNFSTALARQIFMMGESANSSVILYNPQYLNPATVDNLGDIRTQGASANKNVQEAFCLDVTALPDTARAYVVMSNNVVALNGALTATNCRLLKSRGGNLEYFTGKKIIGCITRKITSDTPDSNNNITPRWTASYTIRQNGKLEHVVTNKDIGVNIKELVINELADDTFWSNTGTISIISNANQLYDEVRKWLTLNPSVPSFITASGSTIDFGSKNIVLNKNATDIISYSNNTLTVKASDILAGSLIKSLRTTGAITFTSDERISMPYSDSQADSVVTITGISLKASTNGTDGKQLFWRYENEAEGARREMTSLSLRYQSTSAESKIIFQFVEEQPPNELGHATSAKTTQDDWDRRHVGFDWTLSFGSDLQSSIVESRNINTTEHTNASAERTGLRNQIDQMSTTLTNELTRIKNEIDYLKAHHDDSRFTEAPSSFTIIGTGHVVTEGIASTADDVPFHRAFHIIDPSNLEISRSYNQQNTSSDVEIDLARPAYRGGHNNEWVAYAQKGGHYLIVKLGNPVLNDYLIVEEVASGKKSASSLVLSQNPLRLATYNFSLGGVLNYTFATGYTMDVVASFNKDMLEKISDQIQANNKGK